MEKDDIEIFDHAQDILHSILGEFCQFPITDISEAERFFNLLLERTRGWVILDFLDADYWDCIKNVVVDKRSGLIYLYWRFPESDPLLREMRSWALPGDVNGLIFRFNQIENLGTDNYPLFALQGYTFNKSEIEKLMSKDGYTIKYKDNRSEFFSYDILREKDGITEYFRVINTPLVFGWIFGKNYNLRSQKSSNYLYQYNLRKIKRRLFLIKDALLDIPVANQPKEDIEYAIKQQGNALRTCAENMFKVLYAIKKAEVNYTIKKDNYDDIKLGDLIPFAKKVYTSEDDAINLNQITKLSNDLSHDSGNPVSIVDAIALLHLLLTYLSGIEFTLMSTIRY